MHRIQVLLNDRTPPLAFKMFLTEKNYSGYAFHGGRYARDVYDDTAGAERAIQTEVLHIRCIIYIGTCAT